MNASDEANVTEVYEAWCHAFQTLDTHAMKALFEQDSPDLTYQSEENVDPLCSWDEIDQYWSGAPEIVDSIPEWRELTKKISIFGDIAFIYTKLQTHLEIKGAARPLIGELRVSIGLHQNGGDWKIVHYHESRHVDLAFLFER